MAVKILKKAVEEGAKKAKRAQRKRKYQKSPQGSQSGTPEPGTRGARKPKPKVSPKTQTRNKVAPKVKPKAKPKAKTTKGKGNPSAILATTKAPYGLPSSATRKGVGKKRAAAAMAVIGGGALLSTRGRKPGSSDASTVSFGDAFKEARKKGEGTLFTWNGKSYTAVTKDDLKKKGYGSNELTQYANNKGKAKRRRPGKRIGQGIKKVLLGKDKKFGGDKGLIDFIRGPRSKAKAKQAKKDAFLRKGTKGLPKTRPGMKTGGSAVKKYSGGGVATKGLGKAFMNSKR